MQRTLCGLVMLLLACGSANAALLSRLAGQAYYDDVLNITWLANANLADTNAFGVTGIAANGNMNWAKANEWVAAMNTAAYLGKSDWRLPTVTDSGTSGCNNAFTGTDCGYNVDLTTGEMGHLFYSTLGNTGYYDTSGTPTGCSGTSPFCLTNDGPFSNVQANFYWSGIEYAPNSTQAWYFLLAYGRQQQASKTSSFFVWAVRPGDIAPVPVPAAVWLFGGALGALGWLKRREAAA